MMKKVYIFILFALVCSCKDQKPNYLLSYDKFPVEINLKHETIKTPPILYFVGNMVLLDSALIILDLKNDTLFHVFKLPEFEYLGGGIKKGRGPAEETFVDPFIGDFRGNEFYYRNHNSINITEYSLQEKKLILLNKIYIPDDLLNFQHIFTFDANIFYGSSLNLEINKEFLGFNSNTKGIFEFGPQYPHINKKISSIDKRNIFSKAISVKPDKYLFVSVYDKFPFLRIYKNDGSLLKEVRFRNRQEFPSAILSGKQNNQKLGDLMLNYYKVQSTDEFIYALYVGKTNDQIMKNSGNRLASSNIIHVLDWRGNPVKKIILDKEIFSFEVDKNNSYIICSSLDKISELYKYKL